MKKYISGIVFIILGLLTAIGPGTLFKVCAPMEDGKFMKCHWMARAELGIGFGIVVLAVLLLIFSANQIRAGLLFGIAVLSVLVILFPTALIGVCGGEHMQCNALTRPALLVLGVILLVLSLGNALVILFRKRGSELS